ncbi:MAG: hypothetical protein V3V52_10550, partial [Candidatus Adiutricales bacterium]
IGIKTFCGTALSRQAHDRIKSRISSIFGQEGSLKIKLKMYHGQSLLFDVLRIKRVEFWPFNN